MSLEVIVESGHNHNANTDLLIATFDLCQYTHIKSHVFTSRAWTHDQYGLIWLKLNGLYNSPALTAGPTGVLSSQSNSSRTLLTLKMQAEGCDPMSELTGTHSRTDP